MSGEPEIAEPRLTSTAAPARATAPEHRPTWGDRIAAVLEWLALYIVAPLVGVAFVALFARDALSHDWYTGLKDGTGRDCCGGRDCEPVPNCSSPGDTTVAVVVNGRCWPVPSARVLGMYSPDGQTHACWSRSAESKTAQPYFRCVILPGRGV